MLHNWPLKRALPIITPALGTLLTSSTIVSCSSGGSESVAETQARLEEGFGSSNRLGAPSLEQPDDTSDAGIDTSPDVGAVTLVYFSRALRDKDGVLEKFEEEGQLTDEIRRAIIQPWATVRDGYLYEESMWTDLDERGGTIEHYQVLARDFEPITASKKFKPAWLEPTLGERLGKSHPSDTLEVSVRVRGVEQWPRLEVLPAVGYYSAEGYEAARGRRAKAYAERRRLFVEAAASLRKYVEGQGGRVVGELPSLGWTTVRLPAGAVLGILNLKETELVTAVTAFGPEAGEVSIGELQNPEYTNVEQFHANGANGENGSGSPLLLGIIEYGECEDEACFTDDGSGCTMEERLRGKFNCDATGCSSTDNFETSEGGHGTAVLSIAAGSYEQSQTNPNGAGEPSLPANWRTLSAGFAPEAHAHYAASGGPDGAAQAFGCLSGDDTLDADCIRVDVINASIKAQYGALCKPEVTDPVRDALEQAWLNGSLPVKSAGNEGLPGATEECTVTGPGDAPIAFAVGGVDANTTQTYKQWERADLSSVGGAHMTFGSTSQNRSVTLIDLAAAYDPGYYTDRFANGDGIISSGSVGTSFSAPQVAGAALSRKDAWLMAGKTWINTVGYLHANMLNLGDTDASAADHSTPGCAGAGKHICGADDSFGTGKLKMRYASTFATYARTFTGTSSSHTYKRIFQFPSSSIIAKCSMQQVELMAHKANMSNVTMKMELREPVNGTCTIDQGSVELSWTDTGYDDKHMVSLWNHDHPESCFQVTLDPTHLSDDDYVTAYVYCHTDDERDDDWSL